MEGPSGLTWTAFNTCLLIILLTTILLVVRKFLSKASPAPAQDTMLQGLAKPVQVVLSERTVINHDTVILRFSFPARHMKLGLQIGQHIRV